MRKKNILLLVFILSFFAFAFQYAWAYKIEHSGQSSGWVIIGDKFKAGARYIPEVSMIQEVTETESIDGEISLNASISDDSSDLNFYRWWARYGSEQMEIRVGLQKINFGPATILRSLRWFDRLDVRDPLELTDGVYGVLSRYYFLNNANFWLWGLYGNDDPKGLEIYRTDDHKLELGGRYQFPVPLGEMALTLHQRDIDADDWNRKRETSMSEGREYRYALDGSWDIIAGVWFEAFLSEIQISEDKTLWRRYLTIGSDYTFDFGPGIHLLGEHFFHRSKEDIGGEDNTSNVSALSVDFSIGILDSIRAIGYFNWEEKTTSTYFGLQRTYDNWIINLSFFSNSEDETGTYSGTGAQGLVTYNY